MSSALKGYGTHSAIRRSIVSEALAESCWLMMDTTRVWNKSKGRRAKVQGPCLSISLAMTWSDWRRCVSAFRNSAGVSVLYLLMEFSAPDRTWLRIGLGWFLAATIVVIFFRLSWSTYMIDNQATVHIHRVQKRLVVADLELVGADQDVALSSMLLT